jgi:dipeptidyl aminopeptidase/acylaminoacyl peptidase
MFRPQMAARSSLLLIPITASFLVLTATKELSPQDIPEIEPPLSRLYGSDDLDFGSLYVRGAVSPDGKWLVYSRGEPDEGRMNLWIVPLDGSREATRITTGPYWDADPVWFPSGDRILFESTRFDPEGNFQYLSTLDLHPSTGAPTSVPRQVSLEPSTSSWGYQVSPDGQQIAYIPHRGDAEGFEEELKVIPWNGGNARTVWRQREGIHTPAWPGDGYIYFLSDLAPPEDVAIRTGIEIRRVPANGGTAETVSTWTVGGQLSPDAKHILYRTSPRESEEAIYEIAATDGRRLASFVLPENMTLATCFRAGELGCLATTQDVAAPLTVIPVQGGAARQLTEAQGYSWPTGWTRDSREVLYEFEVDGTQALWAMPLTGGPTREVYRKPPEDWIYGPSILDERYVLYGVETGRSDEVALRLLDIQTESVKEITRTPWTPYNTLYYTTLYSNTLHYNTLHGSSREGGRFLYADHPEGSFEFRALLPSGESQLLRAFPDSTFPPIPGVQGERIAYWVNSNGESTLHLARAGREEAKPVLTLPGEIGGRRRGPVWSPDGRYLAIGYWRPETNHLDALVVEIDPSDNVVGDPLVLEDLPEWWWGLSWLPSSDAFLVNDRGDVWLVSLDPEVPLVKLTEEQSWPTWTFALSPDGRYVAVAPEVRRGGAIWRLDLSGILGR